VSELVGAIRQNAADQRAWQRWFEASHSRLYYVLYWRAGGNVQRAQDAAQEAMLRFVRYRGYERTATDRDALAYLIRTGLNVLAGERPPVATGESLESIEDSARPIETAEQASDLERILAGMSGDDAAVLRMAIAGQTTGEIAHALGVTYTAAASRLHRSKARAKEIFAQVRKKPPTPGL
jgi:DNA-directed RNA polymerase specialized sigma24 family protein